MRCVSAITHLNRQNPQNLRSTTLTQRLTQLESDIHYEQPPPEGSPSFRIQSGNVPVLLSAPHATSHFRSGKRKTEEEYTAAFVRLLSTDLNTHAIYTTHESSEDPNFNETSAYKMALEDHVKQHDIRLVIDLHGMTNKHNIGVAIGTMEGESISAENETLLTPFLNNGFQQLHPAELPGINDQNWRRIILNHPKFTGGLKHHTITRFVSQQLGIPALQIELASSARIVHRDPHADWPHHYYGDPIGIESVYLALTQLINALR